MNYDIAKMRMSVKTSYKFCIYAYTLQQGVVLVSTGSLKMEKLSVAGHHVKSPKLKINAEDNLALAA